MRDSWWRWSILAILWATVAVLKAAFCAVCIFLKLQSLALVLKTGTKIGMVSTLYECCDWIPVRNSGVFTADVAEVSLISANSSARRHFIQHRLYAKEKYQLVNNIYEIEYHKLSHTFHSHIDYRTHFTPTLIILYISLPHRLSYTFHSHIDYPTHFTPTLIILHISLPHRLSYTFHSHIDYRTHFTHT